VLRWTKSLSPSSCCRGGLRRNWGVSGDNVEEEGVKEAQEGEEKRMVWRNHPGDASFYRVQGWPRRTGQVDGDDGARAR
jgi:hypothetical protein